MLFCRGVLGAYVRNNNKKRNESPKDIKSMKQKIRVLLLTELMWNNIEGVEGLLFSYTIHAVGKRNKIKNNNALLQKIYTK